MPIAFDDGERTEATPNTVEAGFAGSHALLAARSILGSGGTKADAHRVALSILLNGKPESSVKDSTRLAIAQNQAKMITAMAYSREPQPQSNLGQALGYGTATNADHQGDGMEITNDDFQKSSSTNTKAATTKHSNGSKKRQQQQQGKKKRQKRRGRRSGRNEPRPVRLRIKRGDLSWVARGYKAISPRANKVYFPALAARYQELMDVGLGVTPRGQTPIPPRVVSVCIPCFNEEALALKRTIESLQEQYLPRGFRLEIVVAMDGTAQISESMAAYMRILFGISVLEDDAKKNPFVTFPAANTVVVESANMDASTRSNVSLVVKRNNKRKVNSQRWWLFGHAHDAQCEFAFATDCGIVFDRRCLMLMLERMDREPNMSGLTGYQRVMSPSVQGDGRFEFFSDPMGYFLRQLQSYDFEMSQSTTKSLVDSFGFIPVLPGPCSLFRYEHFMGIIDEYFSLTTQALSGDGTDIVLGNVQLAEDRFPPVLLTFRDRKNPIETKKNRPVTGFEHDAIFYFEAEKPLGQLVKQRRRWINGAYMAGYWVVKEGWVRRANHSLSTKVGATAILGFEIIQGILIRMITPATIACGLLFMVTVIPAIYSGDGAEIRDILDGKQVDHLVMACGVAAAATYLSIFGIFMFAHTPRAVPVTDKESGEVFYQIDPASAFRPFLFYISYLLNALVSVMFIYVGVGVYRFIGWYDAPIYFKVLTSMIAFPYLVAFMDGVINSKRPSFRAFLNLLWLTPTFTLSSIWFYVWFPSYASARISDLSWGNRAAHQEFASSEIARHRAYLGRVVSVTIVLSNFLVAGLILGVVNIVLSEFLTIVLFSLLGFNVLLHSVNVIDMVIRLFLVRIPHWLCGEPPPPLRHRASNATSDGAANGDGNGDNDSDNSYDDLTMDFTMDRFSVETSAEKAVEGWSSTSSSSPSSSDSSDDDDDENSEEETFSTYDSRRRKGPYRKISI